VQTVCTKCGRTLLARYDLQAARKRLSREVLLQRDFALWRFRELLPVLLPSNEISLGEGGTPVLPLVRIRQLTEVRDLRIKDESFNATGSFKARGLCVAVAKARELGIQEACMPTAGNAGSALAAYGAAAGIRSHIYMRIRRGQTLMSVASTEPTSTSFRV
jgi:threonine synthase